MNPEGPHFLIYRDEADEFRWRFVADNNRYQASSGEGFTTLTDCRRSINGFVRNVLTAVARHEMLGSAVEVRLDEGDERLLDQQRKESVTGSSS